MRALVTGGAGFLGSALANRLSRDGSSVTVLDDLSAGDPTRLASTVRLRRGDVRDIPGLWSLLCDVDVVFHLAARVSVPASVLYPVEYDAVNSGGTVSLMTGARDAGVRRVVFASSGTVYGDQPEQPIGEGAWPHPASPYAVSKLAAEGYVRAIGRLYRIETVVLRIFNAYGPGQPAPSSHPPVVPAFARQLLAEGSVVLHGTPPGGQTRDFVFVDDVVEALVRSGSMPGLTSALLNVGSGTETRIADVAATLAAVTRRPLRAVASGQAGGVARMCADIAAVRSVLEWEPTVDLATGLARTVASIQADSEREGTSRP